MPTTIMAEFECRQAAGDNWDKVDLELVHTTCSKVLCDVESGDNLEVLTRAAMAHMRDEHRAE